MRMKYELAIFDLDGTLLNTIDDLSDSCNFILQKNNFPVHTNAEIKSFVGNGIPKLIERALPKDVPQYTKNDILRQFIAYYREHSAVKTRVYPGISDLLQSLKQNGVRIAVNTNKHEETSKYLCDAFFPGLIGVVCGGREDVPHKPNPAGVQKILKSEKIEASKTVYIGDSDVDIETAKNAGTDSIAAAWGFRGKEFLLEHGAKKIAMNARELEEMILS